MTATAALSNVSESWFVRPKPDPGATMRMFCIPYAGSGAAAYRGWAECLEGFELSYIQPPGRENRLREKPFTDLALVVGALADALESRLEKPYALYGHSLGGVIAFELARQLRERGLREPEHLFVSATRAPQLPPQHPSVRHLPDLDLLEEVQRRYGSVPVQLMEDTELRGLLVPTLRADLTLLETYAFTERDPLSCPIACFGATDDSMVRRESLEPWRSHTTRDFQLRMLEGKHLFLQTARAELTAAIRAQLSNSLFDTGSTARPAKGGQDVRAFL